MGFSFMEEGTNETTFYGTVDFQLLSPPDSIFFELGESSFTLDFPEVEMQVVDLSVELEADTLIITNTQTYL